jgi:hypothetical protein
MRILLALSLFSLVIPAVLSQNDDSKYQPGTIMAVAPHRGSGSDAKGQDDTARYDVSLRVGNTTYVVLYTPPNGANTVEYTAGMEILVAVAEKTISFNSKINGNTVTVPILRKDEAAGSSQPFDISKAPSQYFVMKMKNLSETLSLSDDQLRQIKPIAEQESAEVGAVCFTPTTSKKDRLKRWQQIVQKSDTKMKPILSQDQWIKLQDLRKQQSQELKDILEKEKSS